MNIKEIFELLEKEKLSPKYINIKESGFSRWIEFETKYQKCWIEWYHNVSTLRIGDVWGNRIPFNFVEVNTSSPSSKRALTFINKDVTPNFGLADYEIHLTLQKLDWQL